MLSLQMNYGRSASNSRHGEERKLKTKKNLKKLT